MKQAPYKGLYDLNNGHLTTTAGVLQMAQKIFTQFIPITFPEAARSEGAQLRARVAATEGAVARLQSRLAAADLLIKELFLENCSLAHQPTRLL